MKFGEVLMSLGYITDLQLDVALREQEYNLQTASYSEPIGYIFLRNGVISEEQHETALVKYFSSLSDDSSEPSYVMETAKVAVRALQSHSGEGKLSDESRMILIKKLEEFEDKIAQLERVIKMLKEDKSNPNAEKIVDKENKEMELLQNKIQKVKEDIERFS